MPKGRREWSLQFVRAKFPSTSSVAFCFLEPAELAEASAASERPRFSDRCMRNTQAAQWPQGQMLQAGCKDANPHCACEQDDDGCLVPDAARERVAWLKYIHDAAVFSSSARVQFSPRLELAISSVWCLVPSASFEHADGPSTFCSVGRSSLLFGAEHL